MTTFRPLSALSRIAERESLKPDLSRAIRATVAFIVPLLLAARGWISIEVSFVALAAQNIAMVDVHGAYRLRLPESLRRRRGHRVRRGLRRTLASPQQRLRHVAGDFFDAGVPHRAQHARGRGRGGQPQQGRRMSPGRFG